MRYDANNDTCLCNCKLLRLGGCHSPQNYLPSHGRAARLAISALGFQRLDATHSPPQCPNAQSLASHAFAAADHPQAGLGQPRSPGEGPFLPYSVSQPLWLGQIPHRAHCPGSFADLCFGCYPSDGTQGTYLDSLVLPEVAGRFRRSPSGWSVVMAERSRPSS